MLAEISGLVRAAKDRLYRRYGRWGGRLLATAIVLTAAIPFPTIAPMIGIAEALRRLSKPFGRPVGDRFPA
jgi:hypothetical protein